HAACSGNARALVESQSIRLSTLRPAVESCQGMAPDPHEQAPRRTAARLRDVAEAAGVDTSIASRILSGDGGLTVLPDTSRTVLEAASRLAYRPNTAPPAPQTPKT